MKFPYKFEVKRVRVQPPITKHTPMTKHWPISYLFLLHFEWSSWLWVSSGDLQNLFERWRQRSKQEEAWKGCNVQFKKHESPCCQTLISSSLLVLMIQKIWVHQLELYKTSLNSKGDIIMSKAQTILTHPSLNIKRLTSRPHIFMAMGVPMKIYNTSLNSKATKDFPNILNLLIH
jgi:hypothetical protein